MNTAAPSPSGNMGAGDSDKAQRSAKSGDRRAQQAGGQHSCSPYPLDIRSRTEGKVVTEEQKVKAVQIAAADNDSYGNHR